MKVFLDTNVLIDVLAQRQPFYEDSVAFWTLAEKGQIEGQVSAVSFTNIFYVIRKLEDAKTARSMLGLLRDVLAMIAMPTIALIMPEPETATTWEQRHV